MNIIKIAAISGAIAVVLGAFGAHTLKGLLEPAQLSSFETGVRYQFYHTLAMLLCGFMMREQSSPKLRMAASLFLAGIILFSGSIYILSTKALWGVENISWLGPVTPIGGILFIAGWLLLALSSKEQAK